MNFENKTTWTCIERLYIIMDMHHRHLYNAKQKSILKITIIVKQKRALRRSGSQGRIV